MDYSLGCRRLRISDRAWGRDFCREGFAIGPHGPVLEVFLFPDGDRFFEGVDDPAARVEGSRPVRRRHHDQDAGFANLQTA